MRLLTRSDFDGLACGTLLKHLGIIDEWKFVHPKDMQDGLIEVTDNDVLANVPYVPGCALWFDHHASETERLGNITFEGESRIAPSAARIIYDYYGGEEKMPQFREMIHAVDKVDSANLTVDEIQNPTDWIILGFIMDPRTGLGRFQNYRISNYQLMEALLDECRVKPISEILAMPDVMERIDVYNEQNKLFIEMLKKHSRAEKNVIVTDVRDAETIYSGNRFLIYSLFPEQNISLWVVWGKGKQNVAIAVGHSVLNRTSKTDVGALMLEYGGGGHKQVGTCQVPADNADEAVNALIGRMKADG